MRTTFIFLRDLRDLCVNLSIFSRLFACFAGSISGGKGWSLRLQRLFGAPKNETSPTATKSFHSILNVVVKDFYDEITVIHEVNPNKGPPQC